MPQMNGVHALALGSDAETRNASASEPWAASDRPVRICACATFGSTRASMVALFISRASLRASENSRSASSSLCRPR